MEALVATSSVLVPTPRPPRLIPFFSNPKPSKTIPHLIRAPAFPRCLKVRESRVLVPVVRTNVGSDDSNCGRRDQWKISVLQNQSEPVPASEVSRDENSLMKFADSIWSFVFSDGNPNKGVHGENRWKLIEQCITSKGGIVAAEELAPYLDGLETSGKIKSNPINVERFMKPVLERYEGHPVTDEEGNVLYQFISLQPEDKELHDVEQKFFTEKKWQFSKTSGFERVKNACIEKRNRTRQQAAEALESPDLLLRQKIASARTMAGIPKYRRSKK